MSETPKPTSPSAPRVQPGAITPAAASAAPRMEGEQWEWGLSGPAPVSLPASVATGGLTAEAAQRPVAPPAAHVHVEGRFARFARETMWNPLEGDPLRMAALGAAAEVQQGGWVPQLPAASTASDNGNGAVVKTPDKPRARRRETDATAAVAPSAPAVETAADEPVVGTSTTPPGARLRPVTGRRQREPLPATISITAGSYRSNLSPPLPSGGGAAPAASAMMTMSSGEQGNGARAPWSTRARVLVGLVVALVVAAGAVAAIVVAMPPHVVLQASLAYERDGGAAIDDRALREFQQAQEGLLWSRGVRDAAQEALAKRGVNVEPGFLGSTNQLARGSRVQWNGNADATREELVVEYGTSAAEADADRERLAALVQAVHAAAAAQGSAGRVGELKLQLLEGELADYTRELEYLKRRLQTLEEELRIVRLGAPKEGEVEAMKSEASRLSVAYQKAISERVRAEVEAGVAPRPATVEGAPRPPATGPVQGVAPAVEPGAVGVEQLRRLERDALVALRTAEKHLAEASAQEEAIEQKEREMKGAKDTMDSLSRSMEEKRKEHAAAGESRRPVFKPLPPSPARVVEEKDDRPLWIGVAVAAVSVCFAGYVAMASRGRRADA